MIALSDLYRTPNGLAQHYRRFRVEERLLLTGHSHQAWPDVAFQGQQQAWLDAAEYVDAKWEEAFAKASRVRAGFAKLLGEPDAEIVLGANTHELVIRFLSALPLGTRRRLVTTDGEFHTIRRQLDRLAEEPLEVVKVPTRPVETLSERLAEQIDDRTAAVLVSKVLFGDARLVHGLDRVQETCVRRGAQMLVDVYHALNVVPFSIGAEGLDAAFVVGGGYKYCQMGEGNCFMRIPQDCDLRPVVTGWFAEFDALSDPDRSRVSYGKGASRFAGATYDPTSHYRAATVLDFFVAMQLTPPNLREVSQHQVGLLREQFDALDLDPEFIRRDRKVPLCETGGFLALHSTEASRLQNELKRAGVWTDYRGSTLRLGPAPYLSDTQLSDTMKLLGEVAQSLSGKVAKPR